MQPSLYRRSARPTDEHSLLWGQPLFPRNSPNPELRGRYRFTDYPDGFRIEPSDGSAVTVRLEPWAFVVTNEVTDYQRIDLLCPVLRLTRQVAAMIRSGGPADATAQTIRAWKIAPSLAAQRERLLQGVNPTVLEVQRAVAAVRGEVVPAAQSEALYRNPYIAQDVLRYPAAAIALAYLESDLWAHFCSHRFQRAVAPSPELAVEAMGNWRGLFAPAGVPYRSLNRTLMNLPTDVPHALLCQLHRVRLERPMLDSLELTTLLLHVTHARPRPNAELVEHQRAVLLHTTADQICRAVARVGTATERELSPHRREDLVFVLAYLGDYPERYAGNLDGWADRAIRWHREAALRARNERLFANLGGPDQRVRRPPTPLPRIAGITFLSSVGAIIAEGGRMANCIASYARDAVAGRSFLFHVEHEGHMASVEVDPRGQVRQAAGPRNCDNVAAEWGRRQLEAWGRTFFSAPKRKRRGRRPDPNQLTFTFA